VCLRRRRRRRQGWRCRSPRARRWRMGQGGRRRRGGVGRGARCGRVGGARGWCCARSGPPPPRRAQRPPGRYGARARRHFCGRLPSRWRERLPPHATTTLSVRLATVVSSLSTACRCPSLDIVICASLPPRVIHRHVGIDKPRASVLLVPLPPSPPLTVVTAVVVGPVEAHVDALLPADAIAVLVAPLALSLPLAAQPTRGGQ